MGRNHHSHQTYRQIIFQNTPKTPYFWPKTAPNTLQNTLCRSLQRHKMIWKIFCRRKRRSWPNLTRLVDFGWSRSPQTPAKAPNHVLVWDGCLEPKATGNRFCRKSPILPPHLPHFQGSLGCVRLQVVESRSQKTTCPVSNLNSTCKWVI